MLNPLPDDKTLDWSKLKAFADDKLNVTQNIKVVFHRIDNIVGKEDNAAYHAKTISEVGKKTLLEKEKMLGTSIFSFSPNVFKRLLFQGL